MLSGVDVRAAARSIPATPVPSLQREITAGCRPATPHVVVLVVDGPTGGRPDEAPLTRCPCFLGLAVEGAVELVEVVVVVPGHHRDKVVDRHPAADRMDAPTPELLR